MAASIDVAFGRALLRTMMPTVRRVTTARERSDAWVYDHGRGHWEFHGPEGFYWHGSAGGAHDARHNGWGAWWEALKADHGRLVARLERDGEEVGRE